MEGAYAGRIIAKSVMIFFDIFALIVETMVQFLEKNVLSVRHAHPPKSAQV